MTRRTAELAGILAAVPTPFTADGQALDEQGIAEQVERMVTGGVAGIVPTGSTGEFYSLSPEEYREVIRLNVAAAAGRITVVAGVGATSTEAALDQAVSAAEAGVDAIMVVPPFYDPLSFTALKIFLQRISDAVDLEIMYYNLPSATGIHLDADQLAELGTIEGVNYFKDTSGDAVSFTDILVNRPTSITAFNGWDTLTFYGLCLGATGSVWGVAAIAPRQAAELFTTIAVEQDLEKGRELWAPLWELSSVLESVSYPAGVKTALELCGHPVGPVREPLLPLSAEDRDRLSAALDRLGLLAP